MKKHVFSIAFIIMFVGILVFQYNESYKFRIEPPSEEWSKEVLIGSVDEGIKTYPKILDFSDGSNLIVYQNGENLKAEVIDKLGKKKNELVIPVGDKFIKSLNLISDGDNTNISWITSKHSIKTMYNIKVDGNLKIIEQNQETDVQEATQAGEDILVLTYKDKIVLRDISNNISTVKKVTSPALVSAVNTNQGYLITYHENGRNFKYFFIKDGVTSDISLAAALAPDSKGGYFDRASLGSDNKYAYLMVEAKTAADRFGIIKCITFSLDGKEKSMEDLKIGPFRRNFGAVAISSGDEARFIASSTRYYERKDSQEDIIDFTIKNGEVVKYSFASRTKEPSMYPAMSNDIIIFFSYLDTDKYDIYMTSTDDEFKNVYNVTRNIEKSRALTDTSVGFIYSVIYVFLFGLQWILAGLTTISGFTYFAHAMNIKVKSILYILCYFVLAAVKVATVYSKAAELPEILNAPYIIIGS
ncbi:MAG: hypothetical protein K0R09_2842, partial [Clostridiales bacterium]|nr:hypothetical protein [Clostridiales bacterium]